MGTVGLRELRQDASDLIRRVEAGEEITITVSGRPSARLVAVGPRRWSQWERIEDLFRGDHDTTWTQTRELLDDSIVDPWSRR